MKNFFMVLTVLFSVSVQAQEGSVKELRQVFAYVMRVAETPCSQELRSKFPGGVCYLHGYDDFFDFKEALTSFIAGPEFLLEPWHTVTMTLGNEAVETFQARYRLEENLGQLTFTYVSESLLVLASDVRASP